jgi:hypothetical protein
MVKRARMLRTDEMGRRGLIDLLTPRIGGPTAIVARGMRSFRPNQTGMNKTRQSIEQKVPSVRLFSAG